MKHGHGEIGLFGLSRAAGYGVGGERWLPELIVPWLPGYENSSPVRIGNAAYDQLQIDVFGEVADAMFQALKAGMPRSERGEALRPIVLEHAGQRGGDCGRSKRAASRAALKRAERSAMKAR